MTTPRARRSRGVTPGPVPVDAAPATLPGDNPGGVAGVRVRNTSARPVFAAGQWHPVGARAYPPGWFSPRQLDALAALGPLTVRPDPAPAA